MAEQTLRLGLEGGTTHHTRSRGGCRACRRGKKKCDEVKPVCGLCSRLGRDCSWLPQIMLNRPHASCNGATLMLKPTLPPVIFMDRAHSRIPYFLSTALWGKGQEASPITLIPELQYARSPNTLTWVCLDAMAFMYWTMAHGSPDAVARCRQVRGTCLRRIREQLAKREVSADLLAAVSLIRLFETIIPDGPSEWLVHAQGLASVFCALGPHAFQSNNMKKIYEKNRWTLVTAYSVLRKKSPFDYDTWKTTPWLFSKKNAFQKLLDTYTRLPALHAAWDAGAPDLGVDVWQMLRELHAWRRDADADLGRATMVRSISRLAEYKCPWIISCRLEAIESGYALTLFNMMIIILCRYLTLLPRRHEPVDGPAVRTGGILNSHVLPLGDPDSRATQAADEIASATAWILDTAAIGAMYVAGPTLVCHGLWQRTDPKKAMWTGSILRYINSAWKADCRGPLHETALPDYQYSKT